MDALERWRDELGAAMAGPNGTLAVADRLCRASAELLHLNGAAISLTMDGMNRGTFGSSSAMSGHLDELQFTFGEGPCLEAASADAPVLVHDLDDTADTRWPAFTGAMLDAGVRVVFALPVRLAARPVGALNLYRTDRGPLSVTALAADC